MDALMAALTAQQGDSAALDDLAARVDALESAAPRLLVVNDEGAAWGAELPASRHPMLETLILTVSARDLSGHRINAWLAGPAGSGKTTAARMAANALGLTFGPMGAFSQAHELFGFVDANGTFHETPFTRAYRAGGLVLLDEIDSSDAAVTLLLNGPLDNGLLTLPTGEVVERHENFVCIGAANTYGNGATASYIGRNPLDGAFLDRFAFLDWTYDEALETALAGNADWSGRVQSARRRAAKAGLKVLITPRASIRGAALLRQGLAPAVVAKMTYLRGLTDAQIQQIEVA
jgi:cobaltochelatase CobS